MSIRVMTNVWDHSQQEGSTLLLLLAIADHAGDDGFCWPGTERLAQKIRMSVRSVYRKVQDLEKSKELFVLRREHNWYVVRLGLTDEQVLAVLEARGCELTKEERDNLSRDIAMSPERDNSVTHDVTEQCHPNRNDPPSNRQEEPPAADSPPLDDSWPTDRPPTKGREPHTAEQVKAGIRHAIEQNARNGNGRAGVADPMQDDEWADKPLKALCVLLGHDYEHLKTGQHNDWPRQLRKWAESWEDDYMPTPQETFQCIQGITESEHSWKTFTSPRQTSFQETMDIMLSRLRSGQPWNANGGKANGGSSEPRQKEPQGDVIFEQPDWLGVQV